MEENIISAEELAQRLQDIVTRHKAMGRSDLILRSIGGGTLEELKLETAKHTLSRLVVTSDFRFLLPDYGNVEVDLQPVHKAVYLLFLNHPEGIEFKRLADYRDELRRWYRMTARLMDGKKMEESIQHLTNPLDNAINEKCSRIKRAFMEIMDDYSAHYYIISGHSPFNAKNSGKVWYKRLKVILLPRHLLEMDNQ